jgi:uncharacterized protein
MIGTVNTTESFQATLRYVARERSKRIYANFSAGTSEDVNAMAKQMEVRAESSDRVEKPCYHISISPAPDDELSQGEWAGFTRDFLHEMHLGDRQAVGWLHHDAQFPDGSPRPHLHLVVNRVGEVGKTYHTAWDYRKVDQVLRNLEESYGLEAVPPAEAVEIKRDTPGQVHRLQNQQANYLNPDHPRTEPPEPSQRSQIQRAIEAAIEDAASVEGIAGFLHRQGIHTRFSKRGWSFEKDGVTFAGHQLGQRYSMNSIEQTIMVNPAHAPEQADALDPTQAGADGVAKRQQQRRRTMAEIMQASADGKEGEQDAIVQAKDLQHTGRGLTQQSEDVDGLTLIGGAVATAGALAEAGVRFSQSLERARTRAQSERAIEQINQLEAIGDRTTALEQSLMEHGQTGDLAPQQSEVAVEDGEVDAAKTPFAESYDLANERLSAIGQRLGIELEEAEPIELDPAASVGQQLDQMDAAIAQLDQRLGTLEGAVNEVTQPPEAGIEATQPEAPATPAVPKASVAGSLENFVQARTAARGEIEPSAFTSSVGTVELSREGFQGGDSRLTINDPEFGTVFEATRAAGGEWETQIDELTDGQVETLTRLPQSAEAYSQYKRGQQLISTFQSLPSTQQQFEGNSGQIAWDSGRPGQGPFDYAFTIQRQEDGTQQIRGRDTLSDQDVFSATVSDDGTIFVDENSIPAEHTDKLLTMQEQEQAPPAPERTPQPRRSQERELEL